MQKKWKQLLAFLAAPLAALWGLIVWTVTLFRPPQTGCWRRISSGSALPPISTPGSGC